jgi:uncharacterized phage-associated protein
MPESIKSEKEQRLINELIEAWDLGPVIRLQLMTKSTQAWDLVRKCQEL